MVHRQNEQRERPKWAAATAMISLCGLVLAGCPSPDAVTDAGPASDAGFDTPAPYNDRPDTSLDVRVVLDAGSDVGSGVDVPSARILGVWPTNFGEVGLDPPEPELQEWVCGNGRIEGFEDCDDGNDEETDGCGSDCRFPSCGDGVVQADPLPVEWVLDFEDPDDLSRFGGYERQHGQREDGEGYSLVAWREGWGRLDAIASVILPYSSRDRVVSFDLAIHARGPRWFALYVRDANGDERVISQQHVGDWAQLSAEVEGGDGVQLRWIAGLQEDEQMWIDDIVVRRRLQPEECDEGRENSDTSPTCLTDCTRPACGNGVLNNGEECDDGNYIFDDECRLGCRLPYCGDGIADPGEECDDGDISNTNGCTTECRSTVCGDGLWNRETEECDNGALNADAPNQCSLDCRRPWCGNGHLDAGESCDDGNDTGGDGCQPTCRWPICGDGFLDPGESCDDANTDESDGCTSACAPPRCGDGILSGDEICDVGEASVASACALPCDIGVCGDGVRGGRIRSWVISEPRLPAEGTDREYAIGGVEHSCVCEDSCGIADPDAPENGVCQTLGFDRALAARYSGQVGTAYHLDQWACSHGACEFGNTTATRYPRVPLLASLTCEGVEIEQCDEGSANGDTPGGCRADCTLPRCGDGVVDPGEECDGPREQCTPDCRLPVCGNGVWEGEEHCDNGVNNSDSRPNACRVGCRRRTCGDGVVDWGEDCDDANDVDDDACPNDCIWGDCGDGELNTREECDPAMPWRPWEWDDDVTGCTAECTLTTCGDGNVDPNEECEPHQNGCGCDCYLRDVLSTCYDCNGYYYCDDGEPECGDGIVEGWEECDTGTPGEAQCASWDCYLNTCEFCIDRSLISVPERTWPMTNCFNDGTINGGGFVFDDATLDAYMAIRATAEAPSDRVSHFVGTVGAFVLTFDYRTRDVLLGDTLTYAASGEGVALDASPDWRTISAVVRVGVESSPERSVTFTISSPDASDARTPELHLRNVSVVEVPGQECACD